MLIDWYWQTINAGNGLGLEYHPILSKESIDVSGRFMQQTPEMSAVLVGLYVRAQTFKNTWSRFNILAIFGVVTDIRAALTYKFNNYCKAYSRRPDNWQDTHKRRKKRRDVDCGLENGGVGAGTVVSRFTSSHSSLPIFFSPFSQVFEGCLCEALYWLKTFLWKMRVAINVIPGQFL